MLWETKVYHVWIVPLAEEDVQWVFISAMQMQNGNLIVRNERGKSFKLDPKTGRVEGAMPVWLPWGAVGGLFVLLSFFAWVLHRTPSRYRVVERHLP